MSQIILGLHGLAESGKTTAANRLETEHGFIRLSFAAPLKKMLEVLVPEPGPKEEPVPMLCGKSRRQAYQALGTGWGRELIGEDLWVIHLLKKIEPGKNYVIDDVRHDNEARALKALGATIVVIDKPGVRQMNHSSEAGISPELVDVTIDNSGTLEELHANIRELLS